MLLRGPRRLGGWRVRLGRALMLLFPGWNGSSLWLFGRARDRAAAGAGNARGDRRAAVPPLPQPPCTSACLRSASGLAGAGPTFLEVHTVPRRGAARAPGAIRSVERRATLRVVSVGLIGAGVTRSADERARRGPGVSVLRHPRNAECVAYQVIEQSATGQPPDPARQNLLAQNLVTLVDVPSAGRVPEAVLIQGMTQL